MRKIILLLIFVIVASCNSKKKNSIVSDKSETSIKKDTIGDTSKENQVDTTFVFSKNRTLNDYKNNIKNISLALENSILKNHYVESIIPINDSEFGYFYDLTYSNEEDSNLFYSLNELIVKISNEGKSNCLNLFLNLAQFVDGDYAESYFDDIEYLTLNNREKFCNAYKSLSKSSIDRLKSIYDKICNNH